MPWLLLEDPLPKEVLDGDQQALNSDKSIDIGTLKEMVTSLKPDLLCQDAPWPLPPSPSLDFQAGLDTRQGHQAQLNPEFHSSAVHVTVIRNPQFHIPHITYFERKTVSDLQLDKFVHLLLVKIFKVVQVSPIIFIVTVLH